MSSHAATIDHHHDPSTSTGIPNKKLLMWTFLASDCMFFGALISTHLIYRLHPPAGGLDPKVVFSPELTSFSTFILLMSSLMMALAVTAIQKGNVKSCRWSLLTTIFFGMIFLGCQVYEFDHFVKDKNMTLSNSLLGTTFYTLTGTHGCHVAIGVLWLGLMYVRSFKVASDKSWFGQQLLHVVALLIALLGSLKVTLGLVHALQVEPTFGAAVGAFFTHEFIYIAITLVAYGLLAFYFARPRGTVQFNEANAIDVESMGLYWHFVDIVWIIIFTAVYLLEYLP
ncbi:MAG: heme-copper oxidase subunit III [Opitutaceae bacterium]|nr:heme-copper oxidase subunit III [Opitutaceae bacterium]